MGRVGEPDRIPVTSENGREQRTAETTAPRRDSAPPVLQEVRKLTEQQDQPTEVEMGKMLKSYSFDDGEVSEDEQPPSSALKNTKKTRYARKPSASSDLGGPSSTEPAYKTGRQRRTTHDQMWNPGAMVISDDSSVEETSDEDDGRVVEKPKLFPHLPSNNSERKDSDRTSFMPDFFIRDGAKGTDPPIPTMKGRAINSETSEWQRMGESIAEAAQANMKGKKMKMKPHHV